MQNEIDIIRDVAARLEGVGIPYMLTGSMAMNYYAQPRMTRDIDLAGCDTAYIERWTRELDLFTLWQECQP